jgi:rare lipoprotein A
VFNPVNPENPIKSWFNPVKSRFNPANPENLVKSWFNPVNPGLVLVIFLSFLLASCSAGIPRFTNERYSGEKKADTRGETYPAIDQDLKQYENLKPVDTFTGIASYYAEQYNGKRTSNGEIYDMNAMTAAHQDLPFGTIVRVINLAKSKSVILRINDRGPLKKGRIIDVSLEAAKQLGMIGKGTAFVQIEILKYGKN